MARAAAIAISSVIVFANTSSVPRKIPGNPIELLIWLGKSDLPVPTIRTPAAFASHGQSSGVGFAMKNPTASRFIPWSHSGAIVPGPGRVNEMTTSAPARASGIPPRIRPALVLLSISPRWGKSRSRSMSGVRRRGLPSTTSTARMCPAGTPALISTRMVALPAAPTPSWATSTSDRRLPTSLRAFITPARTTAAVPC